VNDEMLHLGVPSSYSGQDKKDVILIQELTALLSYQDLLPI
jgi:hypothetical protein